MFPVEGRTMDPSGASDGGESSPAATDFSQHPSLADVGSVTDSVENATYNVGGDMTQIQMISNGESGDLSFEAHSRYSQGSTYSTVTSL